MTINEMCKEKTFELLCKLDKLCEDNGITMMLYEDTLLEAYRSGNLSDYVTTCVDIKDVSKLIDLINKQDDDEMKVETMLDNGRYPVFELRVYNPKTVDFNFTTFLKYKQNCLHVTVRIVEHVPDSKLDRRITYVRYGFYKDYNRVSTKEIDYHKERLAKKVGIRYMQMREKLSSPEKISHNCFNMLLKKLSGDTKTYQIGSIKYKADLLKKTKKLAINGVEFNVPAKTEKFLAVNMGLGWESREVIFFEEGKNFQRFRDASFSWDEFKESLKDIDFDSYFHYVREYNLSRTLIAKYHEQVKEYYNILDRSDIRFKMYQQYAPMKDQIMELAAAENYQELAKLLDDYIVAIGRFADLNLGLCFDPEIFEVTMKVLENTGRKEYVDVFRNLVPEVHKQPLRIMNYKGEYIN